MEDVLIPLVVFGSIVMIVYLTQRHKERKMLISMGQSAEILNMKTNTNSMTSLKLGLLGVGLALGIFAGAFLATNSELVEEAAYFSMIFLFGGISLLTFYFISNKKEKEEFK